MLMKSNAQEMGTKTVEHRISKDDSLLLCYFFVDENGTA